MAQQFPCAVCQEAPDADFMITCRSDVTGMPPGTTLAICQPCLIGLAISWAQELAPPEPEPEPVVIEGGWPGDGETIVTEPEPRPKSRRPKAEANGTQAAEETAAADVDG